MKSILLFAALCCATHAYAGCGTTFCSVNTYWDTQGLANQEGLRIDLRYSYAKADTPRHGSSKASNDPTLAVPGDEVENLRTVNQTLNMDIDYAINRQLSVALGLPWVMRDHSHTIAPGRPLNRVTLANWATCVWWAITSSILATTIPAAAYAWA